MKLYTEEQVKESFKSGFRLAMETDSGLKEGQEEFIDSLTPIELPSDEKIKNIMFRYNINDFAQMAAFQIGAKWMREQILDQNK